ncbi:MAG: hypothetical protein ACI9LO_003611 [Planctomycetota bacterium]|jgi:hypothetical protein
MNTSPQIEPVSTDRLLACLGLAIDEAKLVCSIIASKEIVSQLKSENPLSGRMDQLNKEIYYLEAKLSQVRSLALRA